MEFTLLGGVEVLVDERPLDLGSTKQRAVLAALLWHPGDVVQAESLIDRVWGESPPATARRTLHSYLARLRTTLRPFAGVELRRTGGGYAIVLPPEWIDLWQFRDFLRRAAESPDDTDLLERGLDLWRGTPLQGIGGEWADSARAGLTRQWLDAVAEWARRCLRLGRDRQVVERLSPLLDAYPLVEPLHRHVMLALYRTGLAGDALETYRNLRTALNEQLGIAPSQDVQDLELAILRADPTLRPAPAEAAARPQQLPADVPHFTGRQEELRLIGELFDAPSGSRAVVISAIAGMAGVGKTALAIHVAHRLGEQFPDGQLYVNLQGTQVHRAGPADVLAAFLRALGVDGRGIPDGLAERAAMYRDRLADRRVLIVLDNAADETQVEPLLPGSRSCGVVVTSRGVLAGLDGARQVKLDVLDRSHSIQLLEQIIGSVRLTGQTELAQELARLCGHLPLALRIAAARLAARPHWGVDRLVDRLVDERRRLDELAHGALAVRPSLAISYHGLDPLTQRLFRWLGLLDTPDFAAWVGACLLDADVVEAEDCVDRLVDAQLLDVVGHDVNGQLRYRLHDLTRVFARERAESEDPEHERFAALSRVFAGWLALAERAHRGLYGGDYLVLHGSASRFGFPPAFADAITRDDLAWYESERAAIVSAVRQAAELGLDEVCWDLAVTAVSFFETRNHLDEWRIVLDHALSATSEAGNSRGTAAVLTARGLLDTFLYRYHDAIARLTPALEQFTVLADGHGYALALPLLAFVESMCGRYDSALRRFEHALGALRVVGERSGEILVLRSIGQIHLDRGDLDAAGDVLGQAWDLVREAGLERKHPQVLDRLGDLYLAQGQYGLAEDTYTRMLALVRAVDDRRGEALALHGLGRARLGLRLDTQAEALLDEALSTARLTGERLVEARVLLALGELRHLGGRSADAVELLDASARLCEYMHTPIHRARALWLLGTVLGDGVDGTAARDAATRILAELGLPQTFNSSATSSGQR